MAIIIRLEQGVFCSRSVSQGKGRCPLIESLVESGEDAKPDRSDEQTSAPVNAPEDDGDEGQGRGVAT